MYYSILHRCELEQNMTSKYAVKSNVRYDERENIMTSHVHHTELSVNSDCLAPGDAADWVL